MPRTSSSCCATSSSETLRFIYYADNKDPGLVEPDQEIPAAAMRNSMTAGPDAARPPPIGAGARDGANWARARRHRLGTPAVDWLGVPMVGRRRRCAARWWCRATMRRCTLHRGRPRAAGLRRATHPHGAGAQAGAGRAGAPRRGPHARARRGGRELREQIVRARARRAEAEARGAARLADRAAEPQLPARARWSARCRASAARSGAAVRGAVPRPRPLQGHQRQRRPPGRRRDAQAGRRAPGRLRARARRGRAPGRRRVRDPARGRVDLPEAPARSRSA